MNNVVAIWLCTYVQALFEALFNPFYNGGLVKAKAS